MENTKRILVFGCFDPLHEGHLNFFEQAKKSGAYLLVVVARDNYLRQFKGREPRLNEQRRLKQVQMSPGVDEAILGENDVADDRYGLLSRLEYDVLALGYDQEPADKIVRQELDQRGKQQVEIVRLKAYRPEEYKSSKNKQVSAEAGKSKC